MIYPDLQFASSILVKGDHSERASQLLRDVPHPLGLSVLHRLQLENALLRLSHGSDPVQAEIAGGGLRIWRQYLDEGVFSIQPLDLDSAFAKAASWNAGYRVQPPRWGLLLHPAIAAVERATFMSFDPTLRRQASTEGLELIPETL